MKKYLIALALIVPVIAMAGELNTAATDDFVNSVKAVEENVEEAGELLDAAEETFYNLVDSVVDIPEISTPKDEVMETLKNATKKKDVEAAQKLYETYLAETAAREEAFLELWSNSESKQEIVTYFKNSEEIALSIKEDAQKAFDMDIQAIKSLTDLPDQGQAAIEDLTNQISADPTVALQAKKVIKTVKESIDSIKATKEKAEEQKETAEKLLNWLKDLVKSE